MKFADVRKYVTGLLSASFVNKSILDNLAEDENENLTYKGAAIEGGGGGITELPIATTETLGGVIVGDGLSVDETGVLTALGSGGGGLTELPIATEDTLGGIIVGEGLDIDENGILSVINGGAIGGSDTGCNLKTFTYTGTGNYGSSNPTILTFENKPSLIFISGIGNNNNHLETTIRYKQDKYAFAYYGGKESACQWNQGSLIWEDDKTLKLVSTLDEGAQFNYLDAVYTVTYIEEGTNGNSSSAELPDNIVLYAEDEEVVELPTISQGDSIEVDSELSETSENPVQNKVITTKLNEVFQSVSNGKSAIASAITDKGIPTDADASFSIMVENITNIGGGIANSGDMLSFTGIPSDIIQDEITVTKEE